MKRTQKLQTFLKQKSWTNCCKVTRGREATQSEGTSCKIVFRGLETRYEEKMIEKKNRINLSWSLKKSLSLKESLEYRLGYCYC